MVTYSSITLHFRHKCPTCTIVYTKNLQLHVRWLVNGLGQIQCSFEDKTMCMVRYELYDVFFWKKRTDGHHNFIKATFSERKDCLQNIIYSIKPLVSQTS